MEKKILAIGDCRGISILFNNLLYEGYDVDWWRSLGSGADNLAGGKEEFDLIIICDDAELEVIAEAAFDMVMSAVNMPRMVAVWDGAKNGSVDIGSLDKIVSGFTVGEILSVFQKTEKENAPQ